MLDNWLNPIQPDSFIKMDLLSDFQWGRHILINKNGIKDLSKIKIGLVGIDADSADAVRPHLYALSNHQDFLPVADLGNLKKVHPEVIIPLLTELMASGIIPVILGRHHAYTYAQYMAYLQMNQLVNVVTIDERIPFTLDERKKDKDYYYLNQIFDQKDHFMFNLSQVGYQSHYVDRAVLDLFDEKGYEYIRLGSIKNKMNEVEPTIRDADMVSFDLSVIRQSDAPGLSLPSPSGIFSEEASQLAFFAGMSDKLSSIGFYGLVPEHDTQGKTAQLVAQMIWYFTNGFCSRTQDWPIVAENFTKYQVSLKEGSYDLVFYKSRASDRWWLQLPEAANERQERHQFVPCSLKDYKQACKEDIPDRYLNAFKRFV